MPDWCTNTLLVRGPKDLVADFKKRNASTIIEDDGKTIKVPLQFSALIPMPKELEGTQAPDDENDPGVAERKRKYGYSNWYDWCRANYGTKWDVSDVSCRRIKGGLEYGFCTAGIPPLAWLEKIADIYPRLEFDIRFSEGGNDIFGRVHGHQNDWDTTAYSEESYYSEFDKDLKRVIKDIQTMPYKLFLKSYALKDSEYSEDGDGVYRYADRHVLNQIKDIDLPRFVAREWATNDIKNAYANRLKEGKTCTEKQSGSPRPTTSTARQRNGNSSTSSRKRTRTASSS